MPKVPYPYEVNGKLVTGNGSLIPICSLSNRSLLPSLTVHTCEMRNGSLLKSCVSEISVNQIRVNQGVDVENTNVVYFRIYIFPVLIYLPWKGTMLCSQICICKLNLALPPGELYQSIIC